MMTPEEEAKLLQYVKELEDIAAGQINPYKDILCDIITSFEFVDNYEKAQIKWHTLNGIFRRHKMQLHIKREAFFTPLQDQNLD